MDPPEEDQSDPAHRTDTYKHLALVYIENAFPYLSEQTLQQCLERHQSSLADTMNFLLDNLRFTETGATLEGSPVQLLKTDRDPIALAAEDDPVFFDDAVRYERILQKTVTDEQLQVHNSVMKEQADYYQLHLFKCSICGTLSLTPLNLASCKIESHGVCTDCLINYFIQNVKTPMPIIKCPTPGCDCLFDLTLLQSIVPKHSLHVYLSKVSMASMNELKSQHKDFMQCTRCGQYSPLHPGFNPSSYHQDDNAPPPTFFCQNKQCGAAFCMICHELMHWNKRCEIGDAKMREFCQVVEEAMANCIVPCPNCHVRTHKSHGCNHMTCTCGTHYCYLCGRKLPEPGKGIYDHFGHGCNLMSGTKPEEQKAFDEARARRAGRAAMEKWKQDNPAYAHLELPKSFNTDTLQAIDATSRKINIDMCGFHACCISTCWSIGARIARLLRIKPFRNVQFNTHRIKRIYK